mgnify:CR=1 FL=1
MFCERENSMSEEFENREQLLDEISSLRQRVKELEVSVASHKQSEERYRRLYDRMLHDEGMDGYAAINMDGYFRVSNAAFMKMVGYTAEELRGMIYLDLTPEKWRETERVIIQEQVLSENFSQVYEKELRRKDGSVFPVELRTYLIRSRNGQPSGMWAFVRDITVRKQSENILVAQRDLSLALAGTKSLQDTLQLCLDTAIQASGFDSGGIYILDSRKKSLDLACVRNLSDEFVDSINHVPADSERARVVMAGSPCYLEGADCDGVLKQEHFVREGIKSCSIIPISSQERIIACLNVASHVLEKIPPYARNALESIAGQIGLCIQKAQAEEELRDSEKKYRQLVDFLPIIVFECDKRGNITSTNRAAFKAFGYTQEDLGPGFNALQVIVPEEKERALHNIQRRINDEDVDTIEYTAVRKDGTTFPVRILSAPIIRNNKAVGLRGAIIDMTEIKLARKALQESEERWQFALEGSGDGVWDWNKQTGEVFYSLRWKRMLGYTESEVGNTPDEWDKRVHPEDRKRCQEVLEAHLSGKTPVYESEYRLLCKDGTYKWIMDRGTVINRTVDGKPLRVIGTHADITRRRLMEDELRESRQRLADIINFLPDATLVIDRESRVIAWNQAIEKMTGISAEEMLGKGNYEYALPFYGERRPILIDHALRPDMQAKKQYTAFYRAGKILFGQSCVSALPSGELHLSASASVLRDSRGEIIAAIECIRDDTELKKLQDRLNRAEKMEGLGRLAGGVAHDLNNVLGVLVGYSELLAETVPGDSPLKRYAKNILQSGMRGAAIVQDLLTLARRGVVVSEVINLNQVIADSIKTPEYEMLKFDHPDVRIRTHLAEGLLNIKGSPIHLSKTVMNLIVNAAEAVSGCGDVTIRTENRYLDMPVRGYGSIQEGDYAVLSISDTGSGISADDLDKIFEPFYTKKVMGKSGTGLGLAVVWGTVKDHNGYIDVHSEEGKGTTFAIYFPVTSEGRTEAGKVIPPESYAGGGESILVVDDIPEQREMALSMLKRLGYRVDAVPGGEAAVDYLRSQAMDLVVLDMIMPPGMDGLETYERILEINPAQKAIIVSGFSRTERVEKAQKLGAGAYVRKPYILENLGLAVRKELDR